MSHRLRRILRGIENFGSPEAVAVVTYLKTLAENDEKAKHSDTYLLERAAVIERWAKVIRTSYKQTLS